MSEATINLKSKLGWAYTTTPSGNGPYELEPPTRPHYTGTYNQVVKAIGKDRSFNSLGGAFYATAWFYNGQRIKEIYYGHMDWSDEDNPKWVPGWVKFFPEEMMSEQLLQDGLQIRTE